MKWPRFLLFFCPLFLLLAPTDGRRPQDEQKFHDDGPQFPQANFQLKPPKGPVIPAPVQGPQHLDNIRDVFAKIPPPSIFRDRQIALHKVTSRRQELLQSGEWCEYRRLKQQIQSKTSLFSGTSGISFDAASGTTTTDGEGNYVQSVLNYDDVEYVGNVSWIEQTSTLLSSSADHNRHTSANFSGRFGHGFLESLVRSSSMQ